MVKTMTGAIRRLGSTDGVSLVELPAGSALELQTENHSYHVVYHGNGAASISGHPEICPEPLLIRIDGSTWGGSMLKTHFIGRGMCLEFRDPQRRRTVTTSPIREIRKLERSEGFGAPEAEGRSSNCKRLNLTDWSEGDVRSVNYRNNLLNRARL